MVSPLKNKLDLDKSIKRESSWMEVGSYTDVTILDVDPSEFRALGTLRFSFEHQKKSHKDRVFLLNREKDGISWKLSTIIASLFPGPAITDYYQWLTEDDWEDALQALRGMKLSLTIEKSPGYVLEFNADDQKWEAKVNDEVIGEHEQLDSLERILKARRCRKSFRQACRFEAGEDHIVQGNLNALRAALKSRQEVQSGERDLPSAKSPRFIKATTKK